MGDWLGRHWEGIVVAILIGVTINAIAAQDAKVDAHREALAAGRTAAIAQAQARDALDAACKTDHSRIGTDLHPYAVLRDDGTIGPQSEGKYQQRLYDLRSALHGALERDSCVGDDAIHAKLHSISFRLSPAEIEKRRNVGSLTLPVVIVSSPGRPSQPRGGSPPTVPLVGGGAVTGAPPSTPAERPPDAPQPPPSLCAALVSPVNALAPLTGLQITC